MTLKNHFKKMFWETTMISGLLLIIMTAVMQFSGRETTALRTLWGFILLGATLTFRAESLVNFHNLEEHFMHVNYLITSVLADISLLILLYYFTPGGKFFEGKGWAVLFVYIFFKSLFYLLVYLKSLRNAKAINARIKERKRP